MANGTTVQLEGLLIQDDLATRLVELYIDWDARRANWVNEKAEIQAYINATDTTKTANKLLPWKNKTHVPKLCQIRDNLYANYMAALFPKSNWLSWQGATENDQTKEKKEAIEAYMKEVISRPEFKNEISKIVLDYIDYGNTIATHDWWDQTHVVEETSSEKVGYVGPVPYRISPLDVVFNPTATSFYKTGKFIRSLMTLGDFVSKIEQETPPDDIEEARAIVEYMRNVRLNIGANTPAGDFNVKNHIFNIAGFTDFISYLRSNYVEVITFYGDVYDIEKNELLRNHVITIVDRHKILGKRLNQRSTTGDGFYHAGWRIRQDSLYAMGPLDNLVGMQYRIDHLENLKADVFDLIAAPPLKIKGIVDDFTWGPFARIHVGDDGDVEVLAPDVNALNANLEIANLMNTMEEMAGSPKEAAGFRTPGEKTAYEVQRLENAAARIFASKIVQFEEQILEPLLNAMLEEATRKLTSEITIRVFDDELNAVAFRKLTKDDIAGLGRIKPIAARNFAEKAERVQNLNNFFGSVLGQDPDIKTHFSSIKLAYLFEELLDLEDYEVVTPYVRLSEQAEAQKMHNAGQEQVMNEGMAPAGLTPGDVDTEI